MVLMEKLKHDIARLVVDGSLYESNLTAVRILRAIYTFLPNLLRKLFFLSFNVIAFCKEARLISKGEEHFYATFNAFFFQQLYNLSANTCAFKFRIYGKRANLC